MRKLLKISAPRSTVSVALCPEAIKLLGGLGSPIGYLLQDQEDGGLRILLTRDEGSSRHITKYGRSSGYPARITWTRASPSTGEIANIPQFGLHMAEWHPDGDGALVLTIPPTDKLEPPRNINQPTRSVKSRGGADPRSEMPIRRLARVLGELNALLSSGDPDIGELAWFIEDEGGTAEEIARPRRLAAKRTEVLG